MSLHILDLLENAAEEGASRMVIETTDNGRGMSQELIEKAQEEN